MDPRRVGYFISGSSRLSGDLGEYAVEAEQVFESPEKPLTTIDFSGSRSIEFRRGNGPTERRASGG
jgi:hypothetical protein